ncbi:MAG: SpoIIE family protein phosphatase [Leptospira sp.]|nr:SpoIIE family protein phosphatase [Leptospira sp.]
MKKMWDTILEGKRWREEVCNKTKSGEIYWVDTIINPVFDLEGNIVQFLSIRNLITKQKQLEEDLKFRLEEITLSKAKLHENEEKLRGMLESQTCYVIRTDLEGNYTYVNKNFMDVFGYIYGTDTILGNSCMNSIYQDDHEKTRKVISELFSDPTRTIQVELRKPLKDGSLASTLWDFTLLTDSNGQPVEVQCVGIDFTERKKVEEITIASNQKLKALNEKLANEQKKLTSILELINKQIDFAESLQKNLLPHSIFCKKNNVSMEILNKPIDKVSGDIYDFFAISETKCRFFIADATGHGLMAGFQTMFIQTEYQRIKDEYDSPAAIIDSLNLSIWKTFPNKPVHYTCCVIDVDWNQRKIKYANAAHPEPILQMGDDLVLLDTTYPIMGLLKDQKAIYREFSIPDKFRMYLYTDGITETHNQNMDLFDLDNFLKFIQTNGYLEPKNFIEKLEIKLEDFREGKPVFDDMTLMVVDFEAPN